jgi:DNA-binding LacI/PurR family transcriptional regulator
VSTIKDVSVRAQVSIKTVSRVINGSAEVSEATRHRVLEVIGELGYRPSMLAKSLVTGKTNTVGVVIPHAAAYVFAHLYFNQVLRGIGEVLEFHRFDLLLHLGRKDMQYAELYYQQRVDGLILLAIPLDDPFHLELIDGRVPAVFTCRVLEENNPTHWVDCDATGGIQQAVDYLVSLGHRDIGFLSGPDDLVLARLQRAGFQFASQQFGLEANPEWIRTGEYAFESGQRMAIEVMSSSRQPTALVCGDDMTAVGAIRGLESLGYKVPRDISVVGFDDAVLAGYTTPRLTTVRQDGYQKGRVAAETLVELMSGSLPDQPRQVVLDTELVVRDSSGPVPAR